MAIETLGDCLHQLGKRHVKPTEVLFLFIGQHEWMTAEQARTLILQRHDIDLDWDAYRVDEGKEEAPGIYLFGPGGHAYRAFEVADDVKE